VARYAELDGWEKATSKAPPRFAGSAKITETSSFALRATRLVAIKEPGKKGEASGGGHDWKNG
jgi:hypothetical protein